MRKKKRQIPKKKKNCNGFQLNVQPILESVLEPTESLTHALNPQATLPVKNLRNEHVFPRKTLINSGMALFAQDVIEGYFTFL